MSESVAIDPAEPFAATAVPLLREYRAKFSRMKNRLKRIKRAAATAGREERVTLAAEYAQLERLFSRLRPAGLNLAQQVSGMIDQGRLSPLERVELQLRLAEFESILLDLPRVLQLYKVA